jgi:hypothetical protein
MRLLGEVKQMDVDADGKASGAFLRARITMSLDKPLTELLAPGRPIRALGSDTFSATRFELGNISAVGL